MAVISGRHQPGSIETASIPNTRSGVPFPEWLAIRLEPRYTTFAIRAFLGQVPQSGCIKGPLRPLGRGQSRLKP